ncbi:predicted protein [Sclerotinia sclerotiorum 1980 UF-70]|uniref:Uncharacterized protein n=1 Tax=Sclerotinia sclerotiorum (strain ATCC 18683 / 1980 / Ss-1) TaxID=665079 RepID=A7F810_SCLS1|nr:predicted protein [Sclerotinia sclerotiorum 1980 UF-70]EDN98881.1 predicted protein [Sclerotinia sclerotiorum 1980 UF-70]
MEASPTDQHDVPIQISISDVTSIDSEPSSPPTISLKVTLRNTSDKPVSFLRWSTPFDIRAVPMGIFKFQSVASGDFAPCLELKLNRKIPREGVFSDDDIITIDAGAEESKTIEIKAPEVVLARGEKEDFESEGVEIEV